MFMVTTSYHVYNSGIQQAYNSGHFMCPTVHVHDVLKLTSLSVLNAA